MLSLLLFSALKSEKAVKCTPSRLLLSAGVLTAHKDSIVTYNLYFIPAYFNILFSAEKAEALGSAPDYHRHNTARAGINFNITDLTETAPVFSIYNLFVS